MATGLVQAVVADRRRRQAEADAEGGDVPVVIEESGLPTDSGAASGTPEPTPPSPSQDPPRAQLPGRDQHLPAQAELPGCAEADVGRTVHHDRVDQDRCPFRHHHEDGAGGQHETQEPEQVVHPLAAPMYVKGAVGDEVWKTSDFRTMITDGKWHHYAAAPEVGAANRGPARGRALGRALARALAPHQHRGQPRGQPRGPEARPAAEDPPVRVSPAAMAVGRHCYAYYHLQILSPRPGKLLLASSVLHTQHSCSRVVFRSRCSMS
mmetsp:Transcript_92933/g.250801  ORF Transcript_92933/g.250801 Transcript_92933/m.250801 type:complete len:265 (-) Transcript_92933:108-902(-)